MHLQFDKAARGGYDREVQLCSPEQQKTACSREAGSLQEIQEADVGCSVVPVEAQADLHLQSQIVPDLDREMCKSWMPHSYRSIGHQCRLLLPH